jgi:Core-2/I-Branching enzyme
MTTSSCEIGFVILSRSMPQQLKRLTDRLLALYSGSCISCHHDFTQQPLDKTIFAPEVHFVTPHLHTQWGHISLPLALLSALRLLYEVAAPSWFVTLSETDYPVKDGRHVLLTLRQNGYDAYIHNATVIHDPRWKSIWALLNDGLRLSYQHADWRLLAYERYASQAVYPAINSPALASSDDGCPVVLALDGQSGQGHTLFAGDQWMSGNRLAADALLNGATPSLISYFSGTPIPDEAIYQTILCNTPGLKISTENFRYTDWSAGGPHPKRLSIGDLPSIAASSAHFARKFQGDSALLTVIDREFLGLI